MYPNFPNIYNIPGLNLPGMNQLNKSKWSEINPFRTVDNGFQYGSGNNASAGQLYNHFHRKTALDRQAGNENASIADYGLTPGHKVQSISDFLERRNPKPQLPIQPPKLPGNIPGNFPGLPPNFQLPPNIFNAGQGMFPGIDFSQLTKNIQGGQPPQQGVGMPPQTRPMPQPAPTPPQTMPSTLGGILNPPVPQFDPSIFNMQPQMGAGVPRPQPGGMPQARGVM
jgi:hypothetical protein